MHTDLALRETLTAPEACPVCGAFDVRVADETWFAIALDRADEVREPTVSFACRECGSRWD